MNILLYDHAGWPIKRVLREWRRVEESSGELDCVASAEVRIQEAEEEE
jgi:hypothetical protein